MDKKILQQSRLFRGMDKSDMEYALRFFHAAEREYGKGESMHQGGKRLSHFGLVLSGVVQIYMEDINGDRIIMANVTAGETFGESLCFLSLEDTPISIWAATDAEVLWMETGDILACSQTCNARIHGLVVRFIAMLAERTLAMNERIQILSKISLRDKLTTFFLQYMYKNKSRTFEVPFDRTDMAAYLGTNRSALSRELSEMHREGILEFQKNRFHLPDKFEK